MDTWQVTAPSDADVELERLVRRPLGSSFSYEFRPPVTESLRVSEDWGVPGPSVVPASVLYPEDPDGEPLFLKLPIEIFTMAAGDRVVWRVPELHLSADGADDQVAEAGIYEQLVLLRETYRDEADENLTLDGQELKRKLVELFG